MSDQVKPRPPITTGDLSRLTGMSNEFFRQEIEEGHLRAARFGRVFRVTIDEAVRYLRVKKFPSVPADWANSL